MEDPYLTGSNVRDHISLSQDPVSDQLLRAHWYTYVVQLMSFSSRKQILDSTQHWMTFRRISVSLQIRCGPF